MNKRTIILLTSILAAASVIVACLFLGRPTTEEQIAAAIELAWSEALRSDEPAYLQEISRRSSYEIIGMEEGNGYIIHAIVTGIDMSAELDGMPMEGLPQDEEGINTLLIDMVNRSPQIETETIIYAEKVAEGFQITFSDTFVDAMSGRIYSYYSNKINEITGGA